MIKNYKRKKIKKLEKLGIKLIRDFKKWKIFQRVILILIQYQVILVLVIQVVVYFKQVSIKMEGN